MSLTQAQKDMLAAKLDGNAVKEREIGGRKVSYLEGWHAIAEANRIFGFDGWTRETVDLKCVSEKERGIGKQQAPGWGVSYIAKVRVSVMAGDDVIVREGCGTGHGIDRDIGQAHESALKEAETDAMKRALMTFGNPFGLALYDKTQANVADDEPAPAKVNPFVGEPQATKIKNALIENINGCVSPAELDTYIKTAQFKGEFAKLPENHRGFVRMAFNSRFKAKEEVA